MSDLIQTLHQFHENLPFPRLQMRQLRLRKRLLQCPTVYITTMKTRILPRTFHLFKVTSNSAPHWFPLILLRNPTCKTVFYLHSRVDQRWGGAKRMSRKC